VIYAAISGALSDASSSKYRRRFWIFLSTIALVLSTLTLAYCREIAAFCVDLVGIGDGDWTERRNKLVCTAYQHSRVIFSDLMNAGH
jgi:solute carrier family 45 protein 1/2/4